MKTYESTGKLKYKGNWLTLDCNNGIPRYYAWWINKVLGVKVTTPLHGAHITVVAGKYEDKTSHENWGKHQGKKIKFTYQESSVLYNDHYWWLRVLCPELVEVRRELGLSDTPHHPYHLTIGYGEWKKFNLVRLKGPNEKGE